MMDGYNKAIARLKTLGYTQDEEVGHNEMVSDIDTIIDRIAKLEAQIEAVKRCKQYINGMVIQIDPKPFMMVADVLAALEQGDG